MYHLQRELSLSFFPEMKRLIRYLLYVIVICLRFALPILFFKYHSALMVFLITFLDLVDAEFAGNHVASKAWYQKMDKMLDLYWYAWLLTYVLVFYPSFALLFVGLFIYRLIGHILVISGKDRKVLMYFPNLFEYLFFLLFFSKTFVSLNFLTQGSMLYVSIVILVIFKFCQEYFLHIKKLSIRENVFGLKRDWRK